LAKAFPEMIRVSAIACAILEIPQLPINLWNCLGISGIA